jgi:hypothetical protein
MSVFSDEIYIEKLKVYSLLWSVFWILLSRWEVLDYFLEVKALWQ